MNMMARMADLPRSPGADRQIWITRGHLAALAVATAAIAVLAFVLGLQIGRGEQAPVDDGPDPAAFLPDADDEEALEALLREVERAQAELDQDARVQDVGFADELPGNGPAAPEDAPPASAVVVGLAPPDDALPDAPAAGADDRVPTSGFAIQIAAYEDPEEARAHVERLREDGHKGAYQVAALVSGTTWHRVRIGGYTTRDAAVEASIDLKGSLGAGDLMVAPAP